jgi:carbon monoxide dehydrogenase subunit G
MKLDHEFTVPAPIEDAWAAFNDLDRVVPCFPGATLTSFDGEGFEGSVRVKLGPVSLLYTGAGSFAERDPVAHRAVVAAKGKDRRGNGTASARVTAWLTGSGSSTAVKVETDLTVTGRPAQFGRGLMQEVSDKLLDQFVACLTKELGTNAAGSSAQTPAEAQATTGLSGQQGPGKADDQAAEPAGRAGEPAAFDLGSTLAPALARRLAPYLIGAVLALVVRRLLRR